jgi:prevent-host-death family protein
MSQHDQEVSDQGGDMSRQNMSVAEAKKHLSELLGRVAFGKEEFIITKRGKPMARLVPAEENLTRLAEAKGWLDEGDDFFRIMDRIVEERSKHVPRALADQLKE